MENEIVEDRRSAIEAAFEQQETASSPAPVASPAPPSAPAPSGETPASGNADVPGEGDAPSKSSAEKTPASTDDKPAQPSEEEADAPSKPFSVDKAPASWRAPLRAKWDKLDPDVRQEIMRRERDITKTMGEYGEARHLHNQFTQAVAPFQARIASLGVSPVAAAHELFKADYILSTAPPAQRAKFMAQLISDYGVDIAELDSALAGGGAADPVASRVEALLSERLKPLNQFLTAQQQKEQQEREESARKVAKTIEDMANDPKYPYFQDVRLDMADLFDLAAKRGVYLTPEQAYNRAIAMNPEVSKLVNEQQQTEAKRAAARKANDDAQRALKASVSVGGSPGGTPSGASGATDRRSVIAAAFDSVGGRM